MKVFHAASWVLLWTASVVILAAEPVVPAPRIWPLSTTSKPIRSIAPTTSRPEIRSKDIHSLIWKDTGELSLFEGEIEK
jgi:hypothetical protein